MPKRNVLAGYVPVLHAGYLRFFAANQSSRELYLFDTSLLSRLDYLRKEIRALTPLQQKEVIVGLGRFESVNLLNDQTFAELDHKGTTIIMPDEDISHEIAQDFKSAQINYYPVFLRWDRRNVKAKDIISPSHTISNAEFERTVMK